MTPVFPLIPLSKTFLTSKISQHSKWTNPLNVKDNFQFRSRSASSHANPVTPLRPCGEGMKQSRRSERKKMRGDPIGLHGDSSDKHSSRKEMTVIFVLLLFFAVLGTLKRIVPPCIDHVNPTR
ncbi:hypothetical protein GWI33_016258 [Rhynchophorus ferrugineus]|uniref:Uncharacterized protein n=1 Tax=Rhynchophorus ferrugineus TaxID=354439 RepID=A0A834HYC1_RHYFE|nr:hypothetical protein GWI33_016258 [Rhynchophorus ferrugineus]